MNENFEGPPHVTGIGNGMIAMPGTPPKIGSLLQELGHIWGHFEEEYTDVYIPQYRDYNNVFNVDAEGCPKWCSGTLNNGSPCYSDFLWYQNCTSQIPDPPREHIEEWHQCYIGSFKNGRDLAMCNLGTDCSEDTGCYWGAEPISDWRAYPITIMRGGSHWDDGYGYGKINEEFLASKLAELTTGDITIPISTGTGFGEARAVIENEGKLKKIKITRETSKLVLTTGATTVSSDKPLQVSNKKLFIGEKEIKIRPDTAIKKAEEAGLQPTEQARLIEENSNLIYSFKGDKEVKLLFIIPIKMNLETNVSAETGQVVSVNKPWWNFLAGE
jgi:hypothetical protein